MDYGISYNDYLNEFKHINENTNLDDLLNISNQFSIVVEKINDINSFKDRKQYLNSNLNKLKQIKKNIYLFDNSYFNKSNAIDTIKASINSYYIKESEILLMKIDRELEKVKKFKLDNLLV